ncbi:uncharacterized protein DNG_06692 [Cephalotrichum gorgonifer]|uniref:DUF4291 domain-containing protein n=1 Tax=Cephalotrichum gorgonifer TaxID=2041049 RepID=A0AAE8N209_9PEZI|nr:uncharacterized protein DNG_06692 [Cephalotrichum gorgonifer]
MAEEAQPQTPPAKAAAVAATPYRQVRAVYDADTITVYQAYPSAIADEAVAAQCLTASSKFKRGRMTWVKPSWCWMMYRAGYSYKDRGQEKILALKMSHDNFLSLLRRGVLTHGVDRAEPKEGDVRVQWDPERDARLEKLEYRSIQIGIPGVLSTEWAEEWVVGIEDVTARARELKRVLDEEEGVGDEELVKRGLLPVEREFALPDDLREQLKMN